MKRKIKKELEKEIEYLRTNSNELNKRIDELKEEQKPKEIEFDRLRVGHIVDVNGTSYIVDGFKETWIHKHNSVILLYVRDLTEKKIIKKEDFDKHWIRLVLDR